MSEVLGFKIESITSAKQVHGNKVAIVTKDMRGKGAKEQGSALESIDAMVTDTPGILLMIQVADCVPLLFYDPIKKVVGAAHAGWRGTVLQIARHTIDTMARKYRSDPADIYVGIGPSIGPCCYEVGHEVVHEVTKNLNNAKKLIKAENGHTFFDLWEANKQQLIGSGIPSSNIEVAGICTHCNSDTFFSSRAGKGITGRFAAGIMITN